VDKPTKLESMTDPDRRDFLTTLLNISKGEVVDRANDELARLAEEVGRWAGKGKLTLTIEVEPLDKETFGGTGDVAVTGTVKLTPPTPKHASAFRLTGVGGAMDPLNPGEAGITG
jgi:hypothetical protein